MKKIKLLLLISVSAMIFTSCGNKYSIGNLKKNDKLLKETAIKCKQKKDEKICRNVEQAQNELAQEWWKKVKPEVSKKVDKRMYWLEMQALVWKARLKNFGNGKQNIFLQHRKRLRK